MKKFFHVLLVIQKNAVLMQAHTPTRHGAFDMAVFAFTNRLALRLWARQWLDNGGIVHHSCASVDVFGQPRVAWCILQRRGLVDVGEFSLPLVIDSQCLGQSTVKFAGLRVHVRISHIHVNNSLYPDVRRLKGPIYGPIHTSAHTRTVTHTNAHIQWSALCRCSASFAVERQVRYPVRSQVLWGRLTARHA